MRGLMQDAGLTVDKILDHAKNWHGDREVVSRSVEGPIVRTTWGEIHGRAKQVSNLLLSLGIDVGDRVATLAWNTARHIEAWYGIMGIGAVCHTLNPRLHPDQIAWIIRHAEDRIIFVDLTFVPILEQILADCPSVEHVVVMTDAAHMPAFKVAGVAAMKWQGAQAYEPAIAAQSNECVWGNFDENTACGLCYTSGTTGDPKGVLYSHRSNFIHALVGMQKDVLGVSGVDTILPVVPMFHANAWGIAFVAPAVGAKLVMPGGKMDGASISELLIGEEVTFSAAVPTVWQTLLAHLDAEKLSLPKLSTVVIGGSACPEAIIRGFKERYDVDVIHAWGMTETSPLGTLGSPNARVATLSWEDQLPYKLKQGRPPIGIEMKLTDDSGNRLPHDGKTFGNLKVRGPFVVGSYFKGAGGDILDEEGFFDTGDVATIDPEGFMQITDRAKDVVKSGGEWISTIDIENITMGHPKVELAAVIGILHPKWDERPLLLIKLKPGVEATKEEFIDYLQGKIAKWWMPDDVMFVDDIPLGATGKIDKKLLRQRLTDYKLPDVPLLAAMTAGSAATVALRAEPDPVLRGPEDPPAEAQPVPFADPPAAASDQDAGVWAAPFAAAEGEAGPAEGEPAMPFFSERDEHPDGRLEVVAGSSLADQAVSGIGTLVGGIREAGTTFAAKAEAQFAVSGLAAAMTALGGAGMAHAVAAPPASPLAAEPVRQPEPQPDAPAQRDLKVPLALAGLAVAMAGLSRLVEDKPEPLPDPAPERPEAKLDFVSAGSKAPEAGFMYAGAAEDRIAAPAAAATVGAAAAAASADPDKPAPPREEVFDDVPLSWAPGAPEPPRTEHVSDKGSKAKPEPVPPPLPSMPGLTPISDTGDRGDPKSLAFPSSLKSSDAPVAPPPGDPPLSIDATPLSFTPVPLSKSRRDGPKAGFVDHYLTFALLLALAPALLILGGALGMRMELWDWKTGFLAVMANGPVPRLGWAPAAAMLSVLTGVIGLLMAAFAGWKRYWRRALTAVGISLVTFGGFFALVATARQHPAIHDVATDWSEPLLFSPAVMSARGPGANIVEPNPSVPLDAGAFAGRPVAEINRETCPAARPLVLTMTPAQAYAAAKEALTGAGMTLVTDNPAAGRLEATASSLLFGFKDDVAVRIRPQGDGARVDMRSVSRVGIGDMGANCARIGKLQDAMTP